MHLFANRRYVQILLKESWLWKSVDRYVTIPVVFGHEQNRGALFKAVPFSTTVTPIKPNNSCSQISTRNRNSHYMEMPSFCTWTLIPMPPGYPSHLHRQPDCCSMQGANIIRFLPLPSASKKIPPSPPSNSKGSPISLQDDSQKSNINASNLTVDWTS